MTEDKQQSFSERPLSRREYREQLARQQRQAGNDQPAADETPVEPASNIGRQKFADEQKQLTAEQKTAVLKRKLNIAIIILLAAIIAVYLILFFVG